MRTIKNIFLSVLFTLLFSESANAISIVISSNEYKNDAKTIAEKYSLKNLGTLAHKTTTFYHLKSSLTFKGMNTNTIANSNYLKFNKGNISYVIPYRHNLVLSKFKTPSQVRP